MARLWCGLVCAGLLALGIEMAAGAARADSAPSASAPLELAIAVAALSQVDLSFPSPAPSWRMPVLVGIYSLLIVAASLLGGALPGRIALTHSRMQHTISFVGGLMLGIAVFHLLPHAVAILGTRGVDRAATGVMCGIVVMFFLLRAFHFHQHEVPEVGGCGHDHDHDHDLDHGGRGPEKGGHGVHELGWLGVFLGLGLHTLIDGVALGASMQADAVHPNTWGLWGVGTFAAILLHKPLDAVSITSLMAAAGWSARWRGLVNLVFAAMCPLGIGLFLLGSGVMSGDQRLIGDALAFSAGVFLCISLSDLLPEMELHSHHKLSLSAMLAAGILLAWGLRFLEPAHAHLP